MQSKWRKPLRGNKSGLNFLALTQPPISMMNSPLPSTTGSHNGGTSSGLHHFLLYLLRYEAHTRNGKLHLLCDRSQAVLSIVSRSIDALVPLLVLVEVVPD